METKPELTDRQKMFFEPLRSKEELRLYLKIFLNLELPDEAVDEESNSNPLDFVWTVYQAMLTKDGPKRFVVAVSRNCAKTLTASIIRFLGMVHLRRSGTHLAANLEQSASANLYLEKFLMAPELVPYIKTNNTRTKELTGLPPNSFTSVSYANVRIATATIRGVNSQRGSLNTRDEVDLVDSAILSESAFISDPTFEGLPPVEINLSSRKSNSGPIQHLIDEAESGEPSLYLAKWSVVDWMWRCPTEKWRPELPSIALAMNMETLRLTWGEESIALLPDSEKPIQRLVTVPGGCRTCSALIACQGRARLRKSTRGRLRDDQFVGNVLKQVADPNKIVAQALNYKPETSAVVLRMFNRRIHMMKAIAFHKWTIGAYWSPPGMSLEEVEMILASDDPVRMAAITPSKAAIYTSLRKAGWKCHVGVDWGAIDPAVGLWVFYHRPTRRLAILHTEAATGYPNEDWAKYLTSGTISNYPTDLVCPDMADPNSPIYFGRLRIPCRDVKPPKIEPGVSQIRGFLWNPITQASHFAILDDGDLGLNRWTAECMEKWTYKKTPIGYDFKHFEDNEWTHPIDSMRYACDPWIADQQVSFASAQPRLSVQTEVAARMGDKQAQADMKEKETLKHQLADHFGMEFGLSGVFSAEEKMKQAEMGIDAKKGWGPMQANQTDFVPEEVDPNAAEALPEKSKPKVRFRF